MPHRLDWKQCSVLKNPNGSLNVQIDENIQSNFQCFSSVSHENDLIFASVFLTKSDAAESQN